MERLPAIVAADLDGTLLDDGKGLPDENRAALDELARLGIPFVPCTGRGAAGVMGEVLGHPATRYVISANGAVVQEVVREGGEVRVGEPLRVLAVDKADALDLLDFVRDRQVSFDVFADGRMMMEERYFALLESLPVDPSEHALLRALREHMDVPSEEIIRSASNIERVSSFWAHEQDGADILAFVAARPALASACGAPHIIEVTNAGATKGAGLEWLCGHLGIDIADAVGYGDSENDVTMLERAGTGVAMANSMQVALDAADEVTELDNNAGGLGRHLMGMLG